MSTNERHDILEEAAYQLTHADSSEDCDKEVIVFSILSAAICLPDRSFEIYRMAEKARGCLVSHCQAVEIGEKVAKIIMDEEGW